MLLDDNMEVEIAVSLKVFCEVSVLLNRFAIYTVLLVEINEAISEFVKVEVKYVLNNGSTYKVLLDVIAPLIVDVAVSDEI